VNYCEFLTILTPSAGEDVNDSKTKDETTLVVSNGEIESLIDFRG
jgi:hypothetical protein